MRQLLLSLLLLPLPGRAQDQTDVAALAAQMRSARRPDASDLAAIGQRLNDTNPLVAAAALRVLRDRAGLVTAPGAEAERAAVETALLALAGEAPGRSLYARAEALHLLATVATSTAAAQRIAGWLGAADTVVGDAAEFALARMASVDLTPLLRPLLAGAGPAAARAARLLTDRPAALTDAELRGLATREPGRLAATGDARGEAPLRAALSAGTPGALATWLVFLHARAAVDATGRAFALGELQTLRRAPEPRARLAALSGLIELAPETLDETLLEQLTDPDPRPRTLAATTLRDRGVARPELALRLRGAWPATTAPARGALLQVLFELDPDASLPLVLRAATEPATSAVAQELLGRSDAPAAVAALRQSGSDAALGALLAIAGRRSRDQRGLAQELCDEVLRRATGAELRVAALRQLRGLADERTLATLTPLLAMAELREEVAQVQLAVARRMPTERKDRTVQLLTAAHDTTGAATTRRQILQELVRLGVDVSGQVARSGCVQEWQILGPCGACDARALGEQPFGQSGPDLSRPVELDGRKLTWQARRTSDPAGVVDLTFLDPHENTSAYALVDLDWPRDEAVQLRLGSDDGVAAWVNGERVHLNPAARGVTPDDDVVPCRFRAGRNRVLLKISQGGGGFGFCLRVTDPQGQGMDLRHGR